MKLKDDTDARASGYIARYGVSSWELDALDPTTIVDLIRSAIDGYRDHDAWENACTVESGEREVLTATHERWDDVKVMLAS